MKIIIVDDSKAFRDGLKYYLQKNLHYEIIGEANDGSEFLNLPNIHHADVILMDIQMPELNGIKTAKRILWDMNYLKIIAITMYEDRAYLRELVGAGFKGFVIKNKIYKDLSAAIDKVSKGKLSFPEYIKL